MKEQIEEVLGECGYLGITGRVFFKETAFIRICKIIGLEYKNLTEDQKFFLRADMIDQWANTGSGIKEREHYLQIV